jgi:hypothetical protein
VNNVSGEQAIHKHLFELFLDTNGRSWFPGVTNSSSLHNNNRAFVPGGSRMSQISMSSTAAFPAPRQATAFTKLVGGVLVDPTSFFDGVASLAGRELSGTHPLGRNAVSGQRSAEAVRKMPLRVARTNGTLRTAGDAAQGAGRGNTKRRRPALMLFGISVMFGAIIVGGEVASADAKPQPVRPVQQLTVIVQPGDSIWSIARSTRPTGDIRPMVDAMVARHGSASVTVGEVLVIDLEP